MQVKVILDGKEYIGADCSEVTAEEAAEHFYKILNNLDTYQMKMAGCGFLVIGKEAIQRAVFLFLP